MRFLKIISINKDYFKNYVTEIIEVTDKIKISSAFKLMDGPVQIKQKWAQMMSSSYLNICMYLCVCVCT